MRIPAPERLNPTFVLIFIAVIFVGQEIEGTNFIFAVLTATYIALWATALNIAGGLQYASGAFIFFNGFLSVIVGLGFKVFLFQPGERNLVSPNATMFCYCVGMLAMIGAAFFCRALRPRQALLRGFDSLPALKQASIICLIVGSVIVVAASQRGLAAGSFLAAVRQINSMPQMAVMLATTYEIRHSKGKRSLNWIAVAGMGSMFALGVINFTKEGMLLGFVAWFVAAVLMGYDFSKLQLIGSALALSFFVYYLVPYSQYVRNFATKSSGANLGVALLYLGDLSETRRLYKSTIADYDISNEPHLYDQREGFLDRLIIIPADDSIIAFTNKGNVFGLSPTFNAYANVVPHFIWAGKSSISSGNTYAHELGLLNDEDTGTGISFSATGDAYHQAKWLGLLLILPLDLFLYFIITDSLVGTARSAPWAMLPILQMATVGADGGLDGPVYQATYGTFGILVMVWILKYAAPFVTNTIKRRRGAATGASQAAGRMNPVPFVGPAPLAGPSLRTPNAANSSS